MKYLQSIDHNSALSPYNYRMDIYAQQQDKQISRQLYQLLGHSKYHKDLDLIQFNANNLAANYTHTLTPQMI